MNEAATQKAQKLGLRNWSCRTHDLKQGLPQIPEVNAVVSVHAAYTLGPLAGPRFVADALAQLAPGGHALLADIGRLVDVSDWTDYVASHSRRKHGVLHTLLLRLRLRIARAVNSRIEENQRNGIYWLHDLPELVAIFESAGVSVVYQSRDWYRGIDNVVIGRKT